MFSRKLIVFWFLSFFVPIVLTGCGGGGEVALLAAIHNSGGSNNNANTGSNPKLGSVVVEQKSLTTAKVSWQAATDDLTPPEQMMYEVHLSQQTDFTPDNSTRRTTVSGVTTTELSDLEVGKTYYVLVIAIDKNGLQSQEREYKAITLSTQASNPQFFGVSFSAPSDMDKITIAWQAAVDDSTPANLIKYEIHLSQQADFEPSAKTLNSSVTGKTQQVINGLSANTSYYVLVIAVDQDGNRSQEKQYHSVATLSEPIIVNPNVSFSTDEELGLGNATQNGTQYTFSKFASKLPTVGSFLFIHSGDDIHLRKVESANVVAGALVIQTGDAALADILDQVTITSKSSFYDTDTNTNSVATTQSFTGQKNSLKQLKNETQMLSAKATQEESSGSLCEKESSGKVKVYLKVGFQPSFDFGVSWKKVGNLPALTGGQAIIRGDLSAETGLEIENADTAERSVTCEVEKIFLTRRSVQSYMVGPVPVVQVTTFEIKGTGKIFVDTKLKGGSLANAHGSASMGIQFNPATNRWEKTSSEPTLTFSLAKADAMPKLEGNVNGEIHLIPQLTIKFYALAGPRISLDPSLSVALTAVSAPQLAQIGVIPVQMKTFDVNTDLGVNVGLSLGAFGKFVEFEDANVFSKSWTLLSLPELSATGGSGKVNEAISIAGSATDGKNNKFSDSSIKWYVDPSASISGGKSGSLTASKEDTYTAFFSGTGQTTSAIRQYAWADVNVSKKEEEKPVTPTTPVTQWNDNVCNINMKALCDQYDGLFELGTNFHNYSGLHACQCNGHGYSSRQTQEVINVRNSFKAECLALGGQHGTSIHDFCKYGLYFTDRAAWDAIRDAIR